MTIVSIDTHRGAFRTRGRSNGGPGESVDIAALGRRRSASSLMTAAV
jgi:hypothetical protein